MFLDFFELGKEKRGKVQLDPRSSNAVMEVYRLKSIERREVSKWILDCISFYIPLDKAEKTKMHLGYTTCLLIIRDLILL